MTYTVSSLGMQLPVPGSGQAFEPAVVNGDFLILETGILADRTRLTTNENAITTINAGSARGSLADFLTTTPAALDAVATATIGDTAWLGTPGTGIDPHRWVGISGSGASLAWRPEETIRASSIANMTTFIAAIAATTDVRFEVGGYWIDTSTKLLYIFTSAVGAYTLSPFGIERNNLVSTSVSATVGVANMPLLSFTAAALPYATFIEYTLILNATNNSASTVTVVTAASGAGVVLTKPALLPFLSSAAFTVGTEYIEMGVIAIPAGVASTFTVGISAPAGAPGVLGSVRSQRLPT